MSDAGCSDRTASCTVEEHGPELRDYAEINRIAWNEAVPIHRQGRKLDLRQEVQRDDFNVLGNVEQEVLSRIGVSGRYVAQLCCNNGRELISILKMGAASGVGFDISDEAVLEARTLAKLAQADCEFVRTNVLEIGHEFDERFDLVFVSVGALTWIRDLSQLLAIAARLLAAAGHLFIYEMHPFIDMIAATDDAEYDPTDELKIAFSYFRQEPWFCETGLDYVGGTTYAAKASICFSHTLSAIMSAVIDSGLVIREFREYPKDLSVSFAHLEKYGKLPLSYSLLARKGQR